MATGKSSKGRGRRSLWSTLVVVAALVGQGSFGLGRSVGRLGACVRCWPGRPSQPVSENRATTSGWKWCGYFLTTLARFFGGLRSKRQ